MNPSATLVLLSCLLCAACQSRSAPDQTAQADPPESAAAKSAVPAAEIAALLQGFGSDEPWVWTESAIRLAETGVPGLDALESLQGVDSGDLRLRAEMVISLALVKRVPPAELGKRPRLSAIAKPHFARAEKFVKSVEQFEGYYSGERGLGNPNAPAPPEDAQAATLRKIKDLHGFAVPATVGLLKSSKPFVRAHAINVLSALRARSVWGEVQPLATDKGSFRVSHGDYESTETVSQFVEKAARSLRPWPDSSAPLNLDGLEIGALHGAASRHEHAIALDIEEFIVGMGAQGPQGTSLLINGIRSGTHAFSATTREQWWAEARPVWRLWFEQELDKEPASDRRQKWRELLAQHPAKSESPQVAKPPFDPDLCLERAPKKSASDNVRNCLSPFHRKGLLDGTNLKLAKCFETSAKEDDPHGAREICIFRIAVQTQDKRICGLLGSHYDVPQGQPTCLKAITP